MILVTGGTGFVGSQLVSQLIREGHRVRCLSRNPREAIHLRTWGAELTKGDINDPASIEVALRGMSHVIHLVGIIQERGKQTFERVHVQGVQNVLDACRQAKSPIKRIVHMSALGTSEEAKSRYHQTKWQAEELVRQSGLRYTILRPSLIFGKQGEFFQLLKRLATLPVFTPVVGTGETTFQPISVKDVAKCFIKALDNPDAENKTLELGGPEQYTFNELLDLVASYFHKRKIKLHLPIPMVYPSAWLGEKLLPKAPLTTDQLAMLQQNNTCDNTPLMRTFAIKLQSLRENLRDVYGQ